MNKRIVAMALAVICMGLAGCKKEEAQSATVEIVSQSFTRESVTTVSTTAETTEETTTKATNDTTQTTAKKSMSAGRVSKSALEKIEGTLETSAKAGSNKVEGKLSFSSDGFTFTPNFGTPLTTNIDKIMLVFVEYQMESQGEKLALLTSDGQYTFEVEDGYCLELSKYIIIGETQEAKSQGILRYKLGA